jgi:hypothetical protein
MPPIFEDVIFRIEESTGDYPLARGIRNDKAYARAYDLKNQKWMVKLNPNLLFDQINMHEAIVFEKNKISQYNLKTGEMVNTVDSNNFLISTSYGIVYKENGKIGIKDHENKVILAPVFDTIGINPDFEGIFYGSKGGEYYYFSPANSSLVNENEW